MKNFQERIDLSLREGDQWEAELRASEARKRAILDSALDCIITVDHEGHVRELNPAAEKAFGLRGSEVLGRKLAGRILPPEVNERIEEQLQAGDRLLFYTDGLYEVGHPSQGGEKILGTDGLERLFGDAAREEPKDLLPELLQRVLVFEEPLEQQDDRTALLLTLF